MKNYINKKFPRAVITTLLGIENYFKSFKNTN